jgi:selenocysteine lyase/cysteine desulfurase/glycine/D-amino acid oxidase-like deaminating enzyme
MRHHLNAAGASLPSELVLDTVTAHLRLEARLGGYEAAVARQRGLQQVYERVARLLGVGADDIALVESATVGWQRLIDAMRLAPGARVVVTRSTYVSMALSLLELQRSHGIEIEVLPVDDRGQADLEALATALRGPAAFVTASHVPTSSGLIEPVLEIGALARAAGVPFVLDATQSVGQLPVDAGLIGAGAVFATGRKFLRAPRGTGFLYVSAELRAGLRPLNPDVRSAEWLTRDSFELSDTARRFETWEASHALRLGLGAALEQLEEAGLDAVSGRIGALASGMRERLAAVPGVRIADPPASNGSGIVTFVLEGEDPRATLARLTQARIHALAVPAAHGQWDLGDRGLTRVVRASVHVYNDERDIDAVEGVLRSSDRGRGVGAGAAVQSGVVLPGVAAPAAVAPVVVPDLVQKAVSTGYSPADHTADVVVIGAGVHGRSAALALARRGISVLQLEQFSGPHVEGSSHGATRMIRRAYPNQVWDAFVDTAYGAWQELGELAGESLVSVVGGLFSRPGRPGAAEGGLRGPGCRIVSPSEAADIFPGLRIAEDSVSLYDPRAGIIRAEAAMTALRRLGRAAGVTILGGARVLSWTDGVDGGNGSGSSSESGSGNGSSNGNGNGNGRGGRAGDGVWLETTAGTVSAGRVIVCAGPWTGTLLPGFAPKLEVVRIVNSYLTTSAPELAAVPNLGVFSFQTEANRLLYGFPSFEGRPLKVGLDDGPPDPPAAAREPASAEEESTLLALAGQYLRGADGADWVGKVEESLTCRYTMAPRNRFAIGAVPGRRHTLVAAACSGHGFKFGPAIGEALADLVEGVSRPDLDWLAPGEMLG